MSVKRLALTHDRQSLSVAMLGDLIVAGNTANSVVRPNAEFLYLTNFIEPTSTGEDRSVASSSLSLCLKVSLEVFLGLFLERGPSNGETYFAERG